MTTSIRSSNNDAALQINGTDAVVYNAGGVTSKLQSISASVGSNALTITLNPCVLDFRSSTLTSGTVNTRLVNSAISLVISSGSTLGTINATQSRIVVLAIDNAGTVELAAVNISGGNQLDETNLISTTAEGGAGAADSANVIYSNTARTSVAYRVVGYVESTQATAGTWATEPSTVQGYGGQALAAMSSFGYGQVAQNLTASRTNNTTYYNTSNKPIFVVANFVSSVATTIVGTVTVNGVGVTYYGSQSVASGSASVSFIVPPGGSYLVLIASFVSVQSWTELR